MTMPAPGADQSSVEAQPPFEVTTVPIGKFVQYDAVPADGAATTVVELLAQLGAKEVVRRSLPDERTYAVVSGLLADWAEHARPTNTMLYWVGHGESNPDGAWLAVHETNSPMSATGI